MNLYSTKVKRESWCQNTSQNTGSSQRHA